MRKILTLTALIFIVTAFPGHAQGATHISTMRVDIWPEFDRPSVLVIYHIALAPDTNLPVILNLRIPMQATVNAVAEVDPRFGLVIADYSRAVNGEWATLSISARALDIQLEYYDLLVKNGTTRFVRYEWLGDYGVDSFNIVFQSPIGADNLNIAPSPVSSQRDQYDLWNYVIENSFLSENETFTFMASYEKPDDDLSIASMPVEPIGPLENTNGQAAWSDVLPWVLGGIGLVLIVLGLLVLFGFRGDSIKRSVKNKKRKSERHSLKGAKLIKETALVYCNECGRRAEAGDRYCRSCGTQLRHEGE
jgi:hypothetical protein